MTGCKEKLGEKILKMSKKRRKIKLSRDGRARYEKDREVVCKGKRKIIRGRKGRERKESKEIVKKNTGVEKRGG